MSNISRPPVYTPVVDSRGFAQRVWVEYWAGFQREMESPALIGLLSSVFRRGRRESEDANILSMLGVALPQRRPIRVIQSVWANRTQHTAASFPPGSLLVITDHPLLFVAESGAWKYKAGVYRSALANIPTADLGPNDAGLKFEASDYLHEWRWTGSAFEFATGHGSGQVVMGKPDGSAPNGGLWGLCDGSVYAVAQADGTTANVTTKNLTGDVFIKGAATAGSPQAAARATWEAAAKTDLASTGITADTDAHASVAVQSGAGQSVLTGPADHIVTVTDPQHQHVLSDATAQLKVPSEANGGLPLRIAVVFYMRR